MARREKERRFRYCRYGKFRNYSIVRRNGRDKKSRRRNIRVVQLEKVSQGDFYHILFVPADQNQNFTNIKNALNNEPCLLVTESEGMAKNGSMINFKDVNGKLRFEVNTNKLEKSGLKMSQELTRLGEEIN